MTEKNLIAGFFFLLISLAGGKQFWYDVIETITH